MVYNLWFHSPYNFNFCNALLCLQSNVFFPQMSELHWYFLRTWFKADDHTAQWHDYIYRCLLLAMLDGSHPWLLSVCLTVTPMCHGGTWWIFASIIIPFISSLSGASVCLIRVKLLVTLPYTGQILFLHLFKHLIYSLPESLISTKTNKSACTTKAGILN